MKGEAGERAAGDPRVVAVQRVMGLGVRDLRGKSQQPWTEDAPHLTPLNNECFYLLL